ncbi:MAG: methyltransferase [Magnetovibrio sp.]|nr:methyltransferase [Magnetovibrio sp.]
MLRLPTDQCNINQCRVIAYNGYTEYARHAFFKDGQLKTSDIMMDVDETPLLGGRIKCFQPTRGYRTAIDAVLLAASVPAIKGQKVLDIGTGVGASALCLATRVNGVKVTGLELQPSLALLGRYGIKANRFQDQIDIIMGDLLNPPAVIKEQQFDHVMANPPYVEAGKGNVPKNQLKAISTIEGQAKLNDWIEFAVSSTSQQGSITFIHRAERRRQLIKGLDSLGMKRMELLSLIPKVGSEPNRIIVRAWSERMAVVSEAQSIVLHEENGAYTSRIESVLRGGKSLL